MRRSPKLDPPEPPAEPVETCETCGRDYPVVDMIEGELQGKRHEGLTVPYYCPECGDQLLERLVREPEGV